MVIFPLNMAIFHGKMLVHQRVTFSIRIMTGDTPLGSTGAMPRSCSPVQGDLPGFQPELLPAGSSTGESLVEHALLIFSALGLVGLLWSIMSITMQGGD